MHVLKGLLLQIQLHTWLFCCTVTAFQPQRLPQHHKPSALSLKIFDGFLENLDDAIDDFMNKRMGNGEVFYGKRKLNPSGRPNTEGDYNGMGMSDKSKIDVTREYKILLRKPDSEEGED